jgi:hypothetical protein
MYCTLQDSITKAKTARLVTEQLLVSDLFLKYPVFETITLWEDGVEKTKAVDYSLEEDMFTLKKLVPMTGTLTSTYNYFIEGTPAKVQDLYFYEAKSEAEIYESCGKWFEEPVPEVVKNCSQAIVARDSVSAYINLIGNTLPDGSDASAYLFQLNVEITALKEQLPRD